MLSLKLVKGSELADGVVAEMRLPPGPARFSIGRDPSNHWPIPDRTLAISARHCEIVVGAGGAALRDLSTNGTFVNGGRARLAGEHVLSDGDRIELGPYTIVVKAPPPQPPALPPHLAGARPAPAQPSAVARAGPPAVAPAPTRPAPLAAAAALRGGDPAAMLAGRGRARPGLTEILRDAPQADDSDLEVTKIRAAPQLAATPWRSQALQAPAAAPRMVLPQAAPSAGPATPATPATPAAASATDGGRAGAQAAAAAADRRPMPASFPGPAGSAAAPALTTPGTDLRQLALGLGLPADSLAGRNPAEVTAQVCALARAAVTVLRQLLDQQAHGRRQIGSRAPALVSVREVNPIHLAASPEAALLALLAPAADVQRPLEGAAAELLSHHDRLLAAFGQAAASLGAEIAPATLQDALGAADSIESKARLWDLYAQLWQRVGLTPGEPWAHGFAEAALLHLAAAYDRTAR